MFPREIFPGEHYCSTIPLLAVKQIMIPAIQMAIR